MTTPAPEVAKLVELTKDTKICMLTTVDTDGEFVSRPMAHQLVESDGDLWFFSERDSRKVRQIAANPHVGVALSSDELGQFQIACALALRLAQQRHRRGIEAPRPMRTIEPLHTEGVEVVVEFDQLRGRYIYAGFPGQLVNGVLPGSNVPVIVSDSFGRAFVRQSDAIWIISAGVVAEEATTALSEG